MFKFRDDSKLNVKTFFLLQVTLDGDCRFRECNLGNLIADSMVHARSIQHNNSDGYWTDAAIAFMNGGGNKLTNLFIRLTSITK